MRFKGQTDHISPASNFQPNNYNIPDSDFKKNTAKGFSFGASREVYGKVFMKTRPFIQDPLMPGPGTYELKSFVEKAQDKQHTIGRKENFEYPLNYPANPGPGFYQDQTVFNKVGSYYCSKFLNSGSQKFPQEPRNFLKIKSQTPGPGSYDPKVFINQEGKYFVSTYKNSLVRKFGKRENGIGTFKHSVDLNSTTPNMTQVLKSGTPGPGTYRILSEFGKYEMSHASPAYLETTSTTPMKRAQSAISRVKRAQSSIEPSADQDQQEQ